MLDSSYASGNQFRRFYIMEKHCHCDCDPGYLTIVDHRLSHHGICEWEKYDSDDLPQFKYSGNSTLTKAESK